MEFFAGAKVAPRQASVRRVKKGAVDVFAGAVAAPPVRAQPGIRQQIVRAPQLRAPVLRAPKLDTNVGTTPYGSGIERFIPRMEAPEVKIQYEDGGVEMRPQWPGPLLKVPTGPSAPRVINPSPELEEYLHNLRMLEIMRNLYDA